MSTDEPSFAELLESYGDETKGPEPGSRIEASVLSVGQEYVFLQLGGHAEGMIPKLDLLEEGELRVAVGDRVTIYVTGERDGVYTCSSGAGVSASGERPGNQEAALLALDQARVNKLPVEGVVKETNKGGFVVQVMGVRAFCPISQIDNAYCEDPAVHLGHSYNFLVTQLKGKRDVLVSRRKFLEREAEVQSRELWQNLEVGQVFDGTIASVQKYGAFVDIGGTQGLLHVSEIGHERVADPGSVLATGQPVRVAVKSIDKENRKISLSMKALLDDPWVDILASLAPEQEREGTVVRLAPFGAFVELTPGVEGLVHISELGQGRRIANPREAVQEGQRLTVRVLEVDTERRRIALGLPGGDTPAKGPDARRRDDDAGAPRQHVESGGFGTLGDLLKGPNVRSR
ncbi:MAG: S1 RNA-binding domain-containing protein [Pseudomonadota bacterium]